MKMSESLARKLEKIHSLLNNLVTESSRGIPVIVEGEKDGEALRKLDIHCDFILAKSSGKTFQDVIGEVEKKGKKEVILLLDFDERGREWTKRLAQNLERMKIKPHLTFWKELSSLIGRDVKDIEGLSTYVRTLQRKLGMTILNGEG